MLSTPPRPRATMWGTSAAVSCAGASTLVASSCRVRLQLLRSNSTESPIPALLTSTSISPTWSCTRCRTRVTSASSDRSAGSTTTRSCGWRATSSAHNSSSRSARRASSTSAPARGATCDASSLPIPAEAPVTRTVPLSTGGRTDGLMHQRCPERLAATHQQPDVPLGIPCGTTGSRGRRAAASRWPFVCRCRSVLGEFGQVRPVDVVRPPCRKSTSSALPTPGLSMGSACVPGRTASRARGIAATTAALCSRRTSAPTLEHQGRCTNTG